MPATTQVPDLAGRFGSYGGRYVPETLMRALDELSLPMKLPAAMPAFRRNWKISGGIMSVGRRRCITRGGYRNVAQERRSISRREDLDHTAPIRSTTRLGRLCSR